MRKTYTDKALAKALHEAGPDATTIKVASARSFRVAKSVAQLFAGVCVGLLIWTLAAAIFNSSGSVLGFPSPVDAFERLWEYLTCQQKLYGHTIYDHIGASVYRLLAAFCGAGAVGIILGSTLGYFGRIYQIGMVPVAIYQMIPGLAWLPVAILMFGLGDDAAMFIIFAVSSMVITIGVSSGIRMVPPVLVNAAKMTGARGPRIFFGVLIPQAAASIINALRLGMSSAWRVLIAAEMVCGTGLGLGYSIQLTRDLLDYVGSFACITAICLIGLFIDRVLLAALERTIRHKLGLEEQ